MKEDNTVREKASPTPKVDPMFYDSRNIREAYQTLIRMLTEYEVVINRNFRIVSANELFRRHFDRTDEPLSDILCWTRRELPDPLAHLTGEEHVGALCYRTWKNRDARCEDCHVEKCFQDGQPRISRETVVTSNGKIIDIRVSATPVKNKDGKVIFTIQTATDISKQKMLENEMEKRSGVLDALLSENFLQTRENERTLRLVFERAEDMIFLADQDGEIRDINPAGLRLLGYESKGDAMKQLVTVSAIFKEKKDWHTFQRLIDHEGVARDFETSFLTSEGGDVPVEISANVIFDWNGTILGYTGIVRDIAARKKAEEIIRQSNRELAALHVINLAGNSLELEDMLNRTVEEIPNVMRTDSARIYLVHESGEYIYLVASKGLTETFVEKIHMRVRDVGSGILGSVVASGKEFIFSDLQDAPSPFREDLQQEGLKSAAYIPITSKGKVFGIIAITNHTPYAFKPREISFLNTVGNEIGIAVENVLLYARTKKAYEELKEAQEQLIQTEKLASLGKMSATFAHEINNPLAAVLTYVKLVAKILKKPDVDLSKRMPDILKYLETVHYETSRCGEIVKNLLTFARQSSPHVEGNHLRDIMERALSIVSHDLQLKEHRLIIDIPADLPLVKCDFKQIQQAFINVLVNASEAMEPGGTVKIRARIKQETDMVQIDISDTGHGISQENLRQVFEPFFTTKGESKGVGLGLAVVYGIITRHGGKISIKSDRGIGTAISICLPQYT